MTIEKWYFICKLDNLYLNLIIDKLHKMYLYFCNFYYKIAPNISFIEIEISKFSTSLKKLIHRAC